jgi:hypothetical protein
MKSDDRDVYRRCRVGQRLPCTGSSCSGGAPASLGARSCLASRCGGGCARAARARLNVARGRGTSAGRTGATAGAGSAYRRRNGSRGTPRALAAYARSRARHPRRVRPPACRRDLCQRATHQSVTCDVDAFRKLPHHSPANLHVHVPASASARAGRWHLAGTTLAGRVVFGRCTVRVSLLDAAGVVLAGLGASGRDACRAALRYVRGAFAIEFLAFYFGPALLLPLLMFPRALRDRRVRFLVAAGAVGGKRG